MGNLSPLGKWILIDSIIYIIEIILIFLFAFKLNIKYSYKIAFIILMILIVSSYNILVIPIHYYHIIIPRTLVYNSKLVLIILLLLLTTVILKEIINSLSFLKKGVFFYYLVSLVVGSVALILSIYNDSSYLDSLFYIIKNLVDVYLIIVSSYIFYKLLKSDRMFLYKFTTLISIIIFLNFLSLQFIEPKYVWIKWGLPVKALDQSDQRLLLGLIFLIISGYLPLNRYYKSLFLFSFILYGSAFKLSIERTFSVILISNIYRLTKNIYLYLLSLLIYMILLPAAVGIIGYLSLEGSIRTRFYQMINFFHYLKENIIFILIGLGFNKSYKTYIPYPYDPGAWSLVEKYSNYKIALQVPVISDIRDMGLFALFIKLAFILYILKHFLKPYERWRIYISTYLIIMFITQIIPWSPKISIYEGFFLALLMNKSYQYNSR